MSEDALATTVERGGGNPVPGGSKRTRGPNMLHMF